MKEQKSRYYTFDETVQDSVKSQVAGWINSQFGNGVKIVAPIKLNLAPSDISMHAQTIICAISLLLMLQQRYKDGIKKNNIDKTKLISEIEESLLKRGIINYKIIGWKDYEKLFGIPPGACRIYIKTQFKKVFTISIMLKNNAIVISRPIESSLEKL